MREGRGLGGLEEVLEGLAVYEGSEVTGCEEGGVLGLGEGSTVGSEGWAKVNKGLG